MQNTHQCKRCSGTRNPSRRFTLLTLTRCHPTTLCQPSSIRTLFDQATTTFEKTLSNSSPNPLSFDLILSSSSIASAVIKVMGQHVPIQHLGRWRATRHGLVSIPPLSFQPNQRPCLQLLDLLERRCSMVMPSNQDRHLCYHASSNASLLALLSHKRSRLHQSGHFERGVALDSNILILNFKRLGLLRQSANDQVGYRTIKWSASTVRAPTRSLKGYGRPCRRYHIAKRPSL
jgi:hypothetical protein